MKPGPRPLSTGLIKPRVLEALQQANGERVTTRQLVDYVWTQNELDGPMAVETAIARAIGELRGHGHVIDSVRGRNSPGHRLILGSER